MLLPLNLVARKPRLFQRGFLRPENQEDINTDSTGFVTIIINSHLGLKDKFTTSLRNHTRHQTSMCRKKTLRFKSASYARVIEYRMVRV